MTRQRKFDLNRFRSAVMTIARMRARKAVEAELRAQGLKPQDYTYRVLIQMAESYVAAHTEQMITEAAQDVAKFPEFARHLLAKLESDAQPQKPPISTTSVVQDLCANWRAKQ